VHANERPLSLPSCSAKKIQGLLPFIFKKHEPGLPPIVRTSHLSCNFTTAFYIMLLPFLWSEIRKRVSQEASPSPVTVTETASPPSQ
jgi:hypothetical protein